MKIYIADGNSDGSGGLTFDDANYVLGVIQNIMNDTTLKTFLSGFVDHLTNDSLYITSNVQFSPTDNAAYLSSQQLAQYSNAGILISGYQFFDINSDGTLSGGTTYAPAPGVFQTVDIGYSAVLSAENGGSIALAANPDGGTFGESLSRIIFHELSHGLTDYDGRLSNVFGSDDKGTYSSLNYAGVEALAVAAENYIYAKDRGQPSRIGHSGYGSSASVEESFDPALPFRDIDTVAYQLLSAGGIHIGDFYGNYENVDIHKKYYQAQVQFTLSGDDATSVKLNNYITVSVEGFGAVSEDGSVNDAFKDVVSGIAARPLGDIESDLKSEGSDISLLSSANAAADATNIHEFDFTFNAFNFVMLAGVEGLSNERFTDGPAVDYVGPQDGLSTTDPSTDLFIKSDLPAVLIGAAGFSDNKASEANKPDWQPFVKARDIIEGAGGGHSVIIAGNNSLAADPNILIGGGDGDAIFGGEGNDRIYAGKGAELVFASQGQDVVWGDNQTIFAVANSMGAVTIAPKDAGNGDQTVTVGDSSTTLHNVHVFMGNSKVTTFKSDGANGSVFVAGDGGGIFYLKDGDTAVGNPNAQNTYYVPTQLTSSGNVPVVNILNFGPNDKIMIQNADGEGYSLFTGYQATETYITLGGHTEDADPSKTDRVIISRKSSGSSGWPISYPANFDTEVEDPGYSQSVADGYTDFGYEEIFGETPPNGLISDVSYTKISNSAGTISFFSKNVADGPDSSGLNLNITSSSGNIGSASNLKIQETLSYNGLHYTEGVPDDWDKSENFSGKVLTPSSSSWQNTSTDYSVFQNQSIQNLSEIVVTKTPSISISAGTAGSLLGGAGDSASSTPPITLAGTTPGQTLDPGGTYNTVVGEGGGDTIVFNQGYGAVTIDEADTSAEPDNSLQLGTGITAADTNVTSDSSGDIILSFNDTDSVTLTKALLSANGTTYGLQAINFADGTVWHYSDLLNQLQTPASTVTALYGDSGANVLDGQGVTPNLVGNGGRDTFVFDQGYGVMNIAEADTSMDPQNVLSLGIGLLPENATVSGDAQGNISIDFGNGDIVTLESALDNGNSTTYGVQQIHFADGTVWTYADLLSRIDVVNPASQTLFGDGNAQTFDPEGVDDTILGGGGGDTIIYNQGYGALTIDEADAGASPDNVLQLGAGLTAAGTAVTADSSGDIILDFGNGDTITLTNALNSGNGTTYGVQAIEFADGTVWHNSDLLAALDTPSAANTTLYGDAGANVLDGQGIATTLIGNGGGDTFVYKQGYGALTITEADSSSTPNNVLQIGVGLAASSLVVTGDSSGDMILSFGGGDQITLTNGLASGDGTTYGVQQVNFADGTTLSYSDLLTIAETPSARQTTLYGDNGANVLDGEGIAGTLVGGGGGDTFIFIQGYGTLTIDGADTSGAADNVLQVGSGISASTTTVIADASGNLILNFGGGDQVILANALNSTGTTTYGIQQVNYEDGSSLTYAQLLTMADTPSASNTTLYGDTGANTLDSGGIAHTLVGNGGGDTFVFNQGYGALTISEDDPSAGDTNTLQLGAGLTAANTLVTADASGDLILDFGDGDIVTIEGALNAVSSTSNGIQQVNFADGTTWTYAQMVALADIGSASNTVLYGDGQGDTFDPQGYATTINSLGGGDTIIYNQGYGALTINEVDASGYANNVIEFGTGITAVSLSVSADAAGDLIISLGGSDQITITNAFDSISGSGTAYGIEQVKFADGTSLSYADLLALAGMPSATNTTLYGDDLAQTFDPAGIAHTVTGNGGGDTIVYNTGYGALLIDEVDQSTNANNVLQFGAGITAQDVVVTSDASGNVILSLGGTDQITLANQLEASSSASYGVQRIEFADGTSWSAADLAQYVAGVIAVAPGSGNTIVNESVSPGGSTLPTIDFETLPADVTVTMGGDLNSLILTAVDGTSVEIDDIYNSSLGDRQFVQFSDGTVWSLADMLSRVTNISSIDIDGEVMGTQSAETFNFATVPASAAGIKTVSGGGGNDQFIYDIGDGRVEIYQSNTDVAATSTLTFGAGITLSMLTFTADTIGDLIITVSDGQSDDHITIGSALLSATNDELGIQNFSFADGTTLTFAQVLTAFETGSAGYTGTLYGDGTANVLDPAGYSHNIVSNGGGDTILYNTGYGNLTIQEEDSSSNPNNTLVFGAGIDPSSVSVKALLNPPILGSVGGSLQLVVAGSGTITLTNALSDPSAGVQAVTFADGTVWTYAQMVAMLGIAHPSGYPYYDAGVLVGGTGADTLDAAGAAHIAEGNGGGDTFVYNRGYGALDIIEIDPNPDVNTLAFGAGIAPTDVTVTMTGIDRFALSLGGGDVVTFVGSVGGLFDTSYYDATIGSVSAANAYTGIGAVTFADGTTWSIAQLVEQQTPSSSGVLYGTEGSGIFDSRGIAHTIDSSGVNDQIIYNLGYGALTINETPSSTDADNTIAFGAGITPAMLTVTTDGLNLYISLGGGDVITIANIYNGNMIQKFTFQDGESLSYNDLFGGYYSYTQGDGFVTIDAGNGAVGSGNYLDIDGGGAYFINDTPGSANYAINASGDLTIDFGGGDGLTILHEFNSDGSVAENGIQTIGYQSSADLTKFWYEARKFNAVSGQTNLDGDGNGGVFDPKGIAREISDTGSNSDTIVYKRGYGPLTIGDLANNYNDSIIFGPGITLSSMTFSANANGDLIISLGGSDQITVKDGLWLEYPDGTLPLDNLIFKDGTSAYGGGDAIYVSDGSIIPVDVSALAGVTLTGDSGAQDFWTAGLVHTIVGGGGADQIYHYQGDGQLTINETDTSGTSSSVLNINTGSLTLTNTSSPSSPLLGSVIGVTSNTEGDVTLYLGDGDDITLLGQLADSTGAALGVSQIVATDGVGNTDTWTNADIEAALAYEATTGIVPNADNSPTNSSPVVVAAATTNTGAIDDGMATLDEASGTIAFTDADIGDTHTATITGVSLSGATSGLPATSVLLGYLSMGTLAEEAGASPGTVGWSFSAPDSTFGYLTPGQVVTLNYSVQITDDNGASVSQNVAVTVAGTGSGAALDYTVGEGPVTIDASSGITSIQFGPGITAANVMLAADNSGNLTITLLDADGNPTSDSITVEGDLYVAGEWAEETNIGQLIFADGSTQALSDPTSTWIGTESNTTLVGSNWGANTFILGAGGDTVTLGNGSAPPEGAPNYNLIEFGYGDGAATVNVNGGVGDIQLGVGITASDVMLTADNATGNLTITLLDAGGNPTGDSLTLEGDLYTDWAGEETSLGQLLFADGSTQALYDPTSTWIGTAGNTTLVGSNWGANTFQLGAGGDTVTLGNGSVGWGASNYNLIEFGYGDGAATVDINGGTGDIQLGAGITAANVLFESDNATGNLTITLLDADGDPTGDSLTLEGDLYGDGGGEETRLGQLIFADGTSQSLSGVASTWIGTADNTTLVGSNWGANTFQLGAGGDTVTLGNGSAASGTSNYNLIEFGYGDGAATVNVNGGVGDIQLGAGVTAANVVLVADNSGNLTITLLDANGNPTDDSLTVEGDLYVAGEWSEGTNIGQLIFADGSTQALSDPTSTWIGTADNTTLVGSNWGANIFQLGAGGDTITLGNGSATPEGAPNYNLIGFGYGDGAATVNVNDGLGDIQFGAGITAANLMLQADNTAGNVTITLLDANGVPTGDSLTLVGDLYTDWAGQETYIGQLKFADGSSMGLLDLPSTWFGTAENTTLVGSNWGANTFVLGSGGDTITLGNGSAAWGASNYNLIEFGYGDGAATVDINGGTGDIQLGAGITSSDLEFFMDPSNGNVELALTDGEGNLTGDSLTLLGALSDFDGSGGYISGIGQLTFADGSTQAVGDNYFTAATASFSLADQTGYTTDNWTSLTITSAQLLDNATSPYTADAFTLVSVQDAVGGTVALVDGNAVFTPDGTTLGTASFTYTVQDGYGGTATATVSLTNTLHDIVGTAGGTLTGGSLAAQLDGRAGDETVSAGSAGDTLIGGPGDTLYGGAGIDTFVFHSGFGENTVNAFTATGTSHDILQIDSTVFADWAHLLGATTQVGADLQITLDPSDTITLKNVAISNFTSADARFV